MQSPTPSRDESVAPEPTQDELARRSWRRRMRWIAVLLLVWFGVTFGVSYYARELDFVIWGWPFSFWVASQGALLVYMALVLVFARQMGRIDEDDARADR